ncbi:hypothetical protein GMRT_23026 [Giardia muris]|uniref:Uncharacterized protein n=1 Tax=Giardia muris TaxID=5742 RepID=A0A4Z1SNR7_GIAMU|nr:hypothetical protein GMRT_23026 [Giardia muris]|eukprot:TNJ27444.1 hypothetical protein GMRT_23026 [Giardia muris]
MAYRIVEARDSIITPIEQAGTSSDHLLVRVESERGIGRAVIEVLEPCTIQLDIGIKNCEGFDVTLEDGELHMGVDEVKPVVKDGRVHATVAFPRAGRYVVQWVDWYR